MRATLAAILVFGLCFAVLGCEKEVTTTPSGQVVSGDQAEAVDLLRESGVDLTELMNTPDVEIPEWVMSRANCFIVIPHMVRGGFVIGAKHGRGVATCRQGNQWTSPAFVAITGGSWGAQIGVEVADLVLAVMNDGGRQALVDGNFQLGAQGSVAAGPVGRTAQAQTVGVEAGILAYSRTKGLYAGLTLDGAYIRPAEDVMQAYYGKPVQMRAVLTGEVDAPQSASLFLNAVNRAVAQSAKAE